MTGPAHGPDAQQGDGVVYLLVFLSGGAALIYEVVWGRQLATFLGITSYAHTIVLASFMAGLAIGSLTIGRAADRWQHPLRLFALLEAGIGTFGLATLALLPLLQRAYGVLAPESPTGWGATSVRLLMAGLVLLPPTVLMGGTLPTLVKGLRLATEPLGKTVSALYFWNTLGAAAGALGCAYLLLPRLGSRGSIVAAAAINLVVALAVVGGLVRRRRRVSSRTATPHPGFHLPASAARLLLVGFALSGAVALALQVAWIRALTQVIGSSVYAFGLTTASYLFGLALGSLVALSLAGRLAARGTTIRAAALCEAAVGVTVVAGIPLLERLPELFLVGYRFGVHQSFVTLQLFGFALASAILVVPTLFLGALYPLIASCLPRGEDDTGRGVGLALAANSLGTVLGTLGAGLLLLPALGADGLLRLGAVACLGVALVIWRAGRASPPPRTVRLAMLAAIVGFALLTAQIPRWDPALMTSGPFINAARFVDVPPGEDLRSWLRRRSRILYYREGIEATVSVRDVGDERLLVINGKTDGSRHGDRRTQLTLAHLPLIAHPAPRRVLLIGFGTGMSAAAVTAHLGVEQLVVAEISKEVIEASSFFLAENEGALWDPRLRLERADARNYLLTSKQPFDVVLSEPSNPWITGVANLFTRDFFLLARSRLAAGGMMAQWFHTYGMTETDFKSVLRAFSDAFRHVSVWSPQLGDLILLGSDEPHALSEARFSSLGQTLRGGAQLSSIGLDGPADLARLFLLDDRAVRGLVDDAPANTDDHPRVEFNAPRSLYSETTLANHTAAIEQLRGRQLVAPLRGAHRLPDSDRPLVALGLWIGLPPATAARLEWRVSWTVLRGRHDRPTPVGVGVLPVLVLGGETLDLEIERAHEPLSPSSDALLDAIAVRMSEPITETGLLSLTSGERVVWATTGLAGQPAAAMAWSCGSLDDARFSRYVAYANGPEPAARAMLSRLASAVRCARADPSPGDEIDSPWESPE